MQRRLELKPYFDDLGRLHRWPRRQRLQLLALAFLAEHFEYGRRYREREVNALLEGLHTFHDPARLRRALVDWNFLARERDGSEYWLVTPEPPREAVARQVRVVRAQRGRTESG